MAITNNQRNFIRNQLQSELTYSAVGTSSNVVRVTDESLGNRIFSDSMDGSETKGEETVLHSFRLLASEANDSLREIGTYNGDPTSGGSLMSRNVFAELDKSSDEEVLFEITHEVTSVSGTISMVSIYEENITLTGGSTPAFDGTLTGIDTDEFEEIAEVVVSVDTDPSFNADYAYNVDWGQQWDESDGEVDVNLTVNWDTDPGTGNDITAKAEVYVV